MNLKNKYLFIFSIIQCLNLHAITSLVYHFRIAQITKQPIHERHSKKNHLINIIFDEYKKKYHGHINQNFFGDFAGYIYNFDPYYFRVEFAFAYLRERINHTTTFLGIETDDILFTLGHTYLLNDHSRLTISGLFGVPTHKDLVLQQDIEFGTAQIGIGFQLDGAYELRNSNDLIFGIRYAYFIPRTVKDDCNHKYSFTRGNLIDIILAYKKDWLKHGIELGFNERFLVGGHIKPYLDHIAQKNNYIRNNFYIAYKYKFSTKHTRNRLVFDAAYSFDNIPKKYGYKFIVIGWVNLHIGF